LVGDLLGHGGHWRDLRGVIGGVDRRRVVLLLMLLLELLVTSRMSLGLGAWGIRQALSRSRVVNGGIIDGCS
jgi:hypothetical protein